MNQRHTKEFLEANGYDGLFFPGECACENADLAPCDGGPFPECSPGYKTGFEADGITWKSISATKDMKKTSYRCPHCAGYARKIKSSDMIVCEGQVHCQFMGTEDDFEVIEAGG